MSEFYFSPDRYLLPAHGSSATLYIPASTADRWLGQTAAAAAASAPPPSAGAVIRELREANLAHYNDTRTLWLGTGDIDALLGVVRGDADAAGSVAGALSDAERGSLERLYTDCPDYAPKLARRMLRCGDACAFARAMPGEDS